MVSLKKKNIRETQQAQTKNKLCIKKGSDYDDNRCRRL